MFSLLITVSTIFFISDARSLLFLPSFINPFDASTINTSVFSLFCFSTIIIVGMPVPKNIFGGSPIIASI